MMKVELRALEPEDIHLLYQMENDRKLWHVSQTIVPFSKTTLTQYIENASKSSLKEAGQYRFVIHQNQDAIGCIDLYDYDPIHSRAGIGITILETERGKGYAKSALNTLITYTKETLFLNQLWAHIPEKNKQSIQLFEGVRFQRSGTLQQWLKVPGDYENVFIYQRLL